MGVGEDFFWPDIFPLLQAWHSLHHLLMSAANPRHTKREESNLRVPRIPGCDKLWMAVKICRRSA
jgi:hypothetical protein